MNQLLAFTWHFDGMYFHECLKEGGKRERQFIFFHLFFSLSLYVEIINSLSTWQSCQKLTSEEVEKAANSILKGKVKLFLLFYVQNRLKISQNWIPALHHLCIAIEKLLNHFWILLNQFESLLNLFESLLNLFESHKEYIY